MEILQCPLKKLGVKHSILLLFPKDALFPLKNLIEEIGSEKADLGTADAAFEFVFQWLEQQDNEISRIFRENLKTRFEERRNGKLTSLLQYLRDPKSLQDRGPDSSLKMHSKSVLEREAKRLLSRLFKVKEEE